MGQAVAIGAAIAGTALKAGGTLLGAKDEAKQLKSQARQYETQAGLERASSQREAIDERRQAELVSSRALAVAGASGGGVSDPTVINTIADIQAEGEYRALTALYNGETQAQSYEAQAAARRKEAKRAKRAGAISAAATILEGGSSIASRYG